MARLDVEWVVMNQSMEVKMTTLAMPARAVPSSHAWSPLLDIHLPGSHKTSLV